MNWFGKWNTFKDVGLVALVCWVDSEDCGDVTMKVSLWACVKLEAIVDSQSYAAVRHSLIV